MNLTSHVTIGVTKVGGDVTGLRQHLQWCAQTKVGADVTRLRQPVVLSEFFTKTARERPSVSQDFVSLAGDRGFGRMSLE